MPTTSVVSTIMSPTITTWKKLGPIRDVNNSRLNGIGQIHRIAFHPNYNNGNQIVYAGSHYGGLYKSNDRGQNWINHYTDKDLSITSVSGIAVTVNNLFDCNGNGDFGLLRINIVSGQGIESIKINLIIFFAFLTL